MSEQKTKNFYIYSPYYKNRVIHPTKEAIGMNKDIKYLVFGICVAFVLLCAFAGVGVSVTLASATTIYVPDNYAKIQWAIDSASVGDTIVVRDGTYVENIIDINKPHLTIRSENGSANCVVQAAKSYYHVFNVTADNVTIKGFTVTGATGYYKAGIYLYNSDYCRIENVIASNNWIGIRLYSSSNNTIYNNNASNNIDGIHLHSSSSNTIANNTANSNYRYGIYVDDSSNNNIYNNNASNNDDGIVLGDSSSNNIYNNTANSNNHRGIELLGSSISSNNNNIYSNTASDNYRGIELLGSSSNNIYNNNVNSNNYYGISLWSSSNNSITNNVMNSDGIHIGGSQLQYWNTHTMEGNTVNGKPLYYFKNQIGGKVPEDAGQVIVANCTGMRIENLNISNTDVGVQLGFSSHNIIKNNTANSNNDDGISLYSSSNNTIANNTANSNYRDGISLGSSSNNTIYNNNASNNYWGIYLWHSSNNNTIYNNNASNNNDGIFLYSSSNNTIYNNTASNNDDGISLYSSSNNTIYNNTASNNEDGIFLYSSSNNNTIYNNNANSNNDDGISLCSSSNNNTIYNNNANSNNGYGIYLDDSSNNKIYLNNFINNTDNVYSYYGYTYGSENKWNSTEEITYTYKGKTYENYLGNYWDDYTGTDTNKDGIGDTPYSIDSDKDNHPLMEPWENYFAPTENIFDTGKPANPYPSISGTHNGTIKPDQTITVSTLYTYPCAGTGGHAEYARIYNDSWGIETLPWEGYGGDWHNLSFTEPFKLYADEEYKFTIITGSYPQIIHARSKPVTGGLINCTKFTDANGKVYYDWIPAIMLRP